MVIRRLAFLMLAIAWLMDCACVSLAEDLFPDKNLEAAVRQQVFEKRKSTDPLTAEDVKNVSTVIAKKSHIKSLQGLEACRSLALLDLEGNEIVDLAPLANLPRLQSLDLAGNQIQDVTPLGTLAALQYLRLERNQVCDIGPLAALERLNSLYLSHNQITDIGPVKGLKKLWSLYLDHNQICDLTPVAELKGLTTLAVRDNQVSDLGPLEQLRLSNFLFLERNKLENLDVLVRMAKADAEGDKRFAPFWRIYLAGNPLSDEAKEHQVAELTSIGGRVFLEDASRKEANAEEAAAGRGDSSAGK